MVKRAIAIVLGAAAGVALWYLAVWARDAMEPDPVVSFGECARFFADCVSYETPEPQPAVELPIASAATPCKAWLAGSAGGIAALSQCLHAARSGDDAARLEQIRWERRTGRAG